MSLTLTTEPSLSINSAYDMVVYDATSSRDDDAIAVTSVTDSSGRAVFNVASHNLAIGDDFNGSGFSVSTYNVTHEVRDITATTIESYTTYVSDDTGSLSQYNTNTNVGIKVGLIDPNSTKYNITNVYNGGILTTDTTYYGGLYSTRIRTTAPYGTIKVGDLLNFIDIGTKLNGVHLVQSVSEHNSIDEIYILQRRSSTAFSLSGEFEILDKIGGGYPEKLVSGLLISSVNTYRFNISNITKSLLNYDLLSIGSTNITSVTDGIKKIAIGFSEYFEDANSILVESPTLTYARNKEYTNNIFQHQDTGDCDDYKTNASTNDGKFLTNAPSSIKIAATEEFQLSIYSPDTTDLKVAYITYNLSGTAASVAYLAMVTTTSNKVSFPINTNILSTSISKVDVWIVRDSDNVQLTNKQTFVLDARCYPNARRIYWQNNRGGIDAFTFVANLDESLKSKVATYTQPLTYGNSVNDRGASIIQNRLQSKFNIGTEPLKRDHREWLKDLRQSDEVYVVEDGVFVPIIITGGIEDIHDDISLIALDIDYVYANDYKTQLG